MKTVPYNMTINEAVDPQIMLNIYYIKRWCDTINSDLRWLDLDGAGAEDGVRWRCLVELGIKQKPATHAGPRR